MTNQYLWGRFNLRVWSSTGDRFAPIPSPSSKTPPIDFSDPKPTPHTCFTTVCLGRRNSYFIISHCSIDIVTWWIAWSLPQFGKDDGFFFNNHVNNPLNFYMPGYRISRQLCMVISSSETIHSWSWIFRLIPHHIFDSQLLNI